MAEIAATKHIEPFIYETKANTLELSANVGLVSIKFKHTYWT